MQRGLFEGRSGRMLLTTARANEYNGVGKKVAKLGMIGHGRNAAPVLLQIVERWPWLPRDHLATKNIPKSFEAYPRGSPGAIGSL